MTVVPIPTRLARKVASIERSIPDEQERAQALVDFQAFCTVMLSPGESELLWDDEDLVPFREEFWRQCGGVAGDRRLDNLVALLDLLREPDERS